MSADPTCAVCLSTEPFDEDKMIPFKLHCGHVFCMPCVVEMLKSSQRRCPLCREYFEPKITIEMEGYLLPFFSYLRTEERRKTLVEKMGEDPLSRPFLKVFKIAYERSECDGESLLETRDIKLSTDARLGALSLIQRSNLIWWQIVCNHAPEKFRWRALCAISSIVTTADVMTNEVVGCWMMWSKVFGHLSSGSDEHAGIERYLNYVTFNLIGIFAGTNSGQKPTLAMKFVELKAVNKGLFEFPELKLFLTTKLTESSELLTPSLLDDFSLLDKMLAKLNILGVYREVTDLMRKKLPSPPPKCEVVFAEAKFKSRIKKELPFLNNDYLEKIWQIHKDTITVRIVS